MGFSLWLNPFLLVILFLVIKMVYTVTLNPALDYYMELSELKDDVQIADKTSVDFGGKGINVSAILSRLGVATTALGFVGGFTGEKLKAMLDSEGIKADFVDISSETRINVKITGAKNLTVNSNSTIISLSDEQELTKKLSSVQNGDYLVLSGSVPKSMGALAYERILGGVKADDFKLVVDTSGDALKNLLTHNPFLIKPNNFEMEEILKEKLETKDDFIMGAKKLQKMGAENVLVSLGKRGMMLVAENGEVLFEPIIDGKVKNTNGCGDSAVAGFIAGCSMSSSYKNAINLANICANATAFSNRLATRKEIEELAKNRAV